MTEHADTWDILKKDLETAVTASRKPSDKFRYPALNEIIDRNKTVAWNEKQVKKLRKEYNEEKNRLTEEWANNINKVSERAVHLLAEDYDLPLKKAQIIWDFIYENYHDSIYGIFENVERFGELASRLVND